MERIINAQKAEVKKKNQEYKALNFIGSSKPFLYQRKKLIENTWKKVSKEVAK